MILELDLFVLFDKPISCSRENYQKEAEESDGCGQNCMTFFAAYPNFMETKSKDA